MVIFGGDRLGVQKRDKSLSMTCNLPNTRRSLFASLVLFFFLGQQAATSSPVFEVFVGSCLRQSVDSSIMQTIAAQDPDMLLMLGDNVYGDDEDAKLTKLAAAYEMAKANVNWSAFRGVQAIWDDHDFGRNDGGSDYPHKAAAKDLFLSFFNVPADDPRRQRAGLYTEFTRQIGAVSVQFILLDTRSFRAPLKKAGWLERSRYRRYAPDNSREKTILGEAQWKWLAGALAQPADVRVVASSIQILARDHGFEKWHNFPRERTRLLDMIGARAGGAVVLLSGDRHFSAFYHDAEADEGRGLVEMTSSSLNIPWLDADEQDSLQSGPLYAKTGSFGVLRIEPAARNVRLQIRDAANNIVSEKTVAIPKD